jgi:hypothetical protein
MAKQVFAQYPTVIVACETGVFTLAGTVPAYMDNLVFATRTIAEDAKLEVEKVLRTRKAPATSRFADAYRAGRRLVQ